MTPLHKASIAINFLAAIGNALSYAYGGRPIASLCFAIINAILFVALVADAMIYRQPPRNPRQP